MLYKEAHLWCSSYAELTQIRDSKRIKMNDRIILESVVASWAPLRGYTPGLRAHLSVSTGSGQACAWRSSRAPFQALHAIGTDDAR